MGTITVARALATLLERMGTEYLFGVNGHGNWALLDAVVHETRIKGVPARAEDQALQMADGYWRMRRRAPLPVVTTSVGPGNMNIIPSRLLLDMDAGPTRTTQVTQRPILILGTLDTQGPEVAYLAEAIRRRGMTPLVLDLSVLGPPGAAADITGQRATAGRPRDPVTIRMRRSQLHPRARLTHCLIVTMM